MDAWVPMGPQINVDNVLLNLVGSGQSTIEASIRGTGAVRAPSSRYTVIDSVVDPLTDDSVDVGQKVTLIRHSGEPMGEAEFKLVITEPHVDSFTNAQLELSFSDIPEGIELVDLDAWLTTKTDFDDDDTMTLSGRSKYQSATMTGRRPLRKTTTR